MPSEPPLVRMRQIHRRGSGNRAGAALAPLDGLSLDIDPGEILALLGPPGGGKTTALMLLAGFERPDSGEIFLDGRMLAQTPPHRRNIGMVFPGPALFTHLDLAENVAFPLRQRNMTEIDRRVADALERTGLAGLGRRKPAALTQEQQHRGALARAIAFQPKLLLLDEPFAALGRAAREAMQDLLRNLTGSPGPRPTILHATTDAAEALAVADRIAVLDGGRLRQLGQAQAVYDSPADLAVARLMGPTNTLSGTVEAIEDDLAIVRLDCGPLVEALAIDIAANARCIIAIRPERVAVAAVDAEEMGDGAIAATVLEIRPRGDHTRLRLSLAERAGANAEIIVRRPAGVPLTGLAPGQPAAIAWQPYHARAFATAADPGSGIGGR